jgi:hypothetical protein
LLASGSLHGPVVHLVLRQGRLLAGSELGDVITMDFAVFSVRYCALMDRIWKEAPYVWLENRASLAQPPASHHCLSGRAED